MPEEVAGSPGTGVLDSRKLPRVGDRNRPRVPGGTSRAPNWWAVSPVTTMDSLDEKKKKKKKKQTKKKKKKKKNTKKKKKICLIDGGGG